MQGKVVFEGNSTKGNPFLIRYPKQIDAQGMREYINEISKEQTFITYQGEQVSFEYETAYLNNQLVRIENKITVQLSVVSGEKIVGIVSIDLRDKTSKHVAILGISVAKDFRGQGIGHQLMESALKESEQNLPDLKIITLGVFGCNLSAKGMYEKFGFTEYGRLPNGILYKGDYVDHIYMYKNIK